MRTRTLQVITAEGADELVRAVVAHATEHRSPVSVAVVDPAGVLMAFCRMDGAPAFSAQLAITKAVTAATFGRATADMEADMGNRLGFVTSFIHHGGWYLGRGGAPVVVDGVVVGALGVSGNTAEREDQLARQVAQDLGSSTS